MFHYVYKIHCGKDFYIGVRSCDWPPEYDTKYMGSGVWCLYGIIRKPRMKEIVSVHETREQAEVAETRLLNENVGKYNCRNRRRSNCKKYKSHVQQAVH